MIQFQTIEHFPKPGTKADTRMLREEEKNLEETSSENSEADEAEEQKSATPLLRPANKTRSVRAP